MKTCLLCRTRRNGYDRAPANAKKKKKNAKTNDITAANLKATKLAAEVEKSDLSEEEIIAQIEEYTDDGISNVQAHVDVHPNHLFYINGAISYCFLIEQCMFLSARGLTDESGEDSGPPLRTADGSLVDPTLFSTNLEICKDAHLAALRSKLEAKYGTLKIGQCYFRNLLNRLRSYYPDDELVLRIPLMLGFPCRLQTTFVEAFMMKTNNNANTDKGHTPHQ